MAITKLHEIHTRRKSRNIGLGHKYRLCRGASIMALQGPQKTAFTLVGVVVLMGGLAWAAVPFYSWFCAVTGFGGVTGVADAGSDVILDETIKIRFDANTDPAMPWSFKPVEREMELRILRGA
jgi:cytochrome c oxidase assembly protein subunit 11